MTAQQPLTIALTNLTTACFLALVAPLCAAQSTSEPAPVSPAADGLKLHEDAATELPGSEGAEAAHPDDRVWARDVSMARQERARALFEQANAQLNDGFYRESIERYDLALREWDHPGIHYNYALALQMLSQPLKTREHLLLARKFGAPPLGEARYERLQRHLVTVEQQLAMVQLSCAEPDASVSIDGTPVFRGPADKKYFLSPGIHVVQASKPRFVDDQRSLRLERGKPQRLELKLFTSTQLTRYRPSTAPLWLPIGLSAVGVLAAGGGAAALISAQTRVGDYDSAVRACAGETGTCRDSSLRSKRDAAENWQLIGGTFIAAGALTLAVGLVILYLDRPVEYRISAQELAKRARPPLHLQPVVSTNAAALVASGSF